MMKTPDPAKILFETTTTTTTTTTYGGSEIVGSIDDLLIQVFVRLPLKPLFRFKLVSKHWNSIISDPRFLFKEHCNNNNRATCLIFQNYCYNLPIKTRIIVSFDNRSSSSSSSSSPQNIHINIPDTLRIFHSCNGLLVLTNTDVNAKPEYYVYNPTTNQITTNLLKDDDDVIIKSSREQDCVGGMYLAFDPSSKSPPHHYKVVCVWELNWMTNSDKMGQYQFEVYSSETGSWETRGGGHITEGYVDFDKGVYWNGAIHWVGLVGNFMFFDPDHDEIPRVMPGPPFPPGVHYFFGDSCGHLHFAFVNVDFFVYEMRRDYSEWFLKFRVDDDSSQCLLRNSFEAPNICSVVRGNKDSEDSYLVLGTDQGEIIIRYNLIHNTFQTIPVKDFYFDADLTMSFQYIESPCSV